MDIDLPPMAGVIYRCTRKFPSASPGVQAEKKAPPARPPSPAPPSGKKRLTDQLLRLHWSDTHTSLWLSIKR